MRLHESPMVESGTSPARMPLAFLRNTPGLGGSLLPPIGVLLARPLVIALCAVLGAVGGFLFTAGHKDSAATAAIVFATPNGNRDVVALDGATLQRTIAPAWVMQKAATSLEDRPNDLERRTTVAWQQGTRLLNVTATAPSVEQAIARANAVAEAAVNASDDARNQQLNTAIQQANSLLADAPLADADAEVSRRNQIGASLGERQNQIQADSMSLILISPALTATLVGLSAAKGTLVGLASGLLTGAILAVLVGSRGLRVPSPGAMQRLAPDVEVVSSSDLPQIAGQLVEFSETLVVVIATRGAAVGAQAISDDLQRLLAAHGKAVTVAHPSMSEDLSSIALLRRDAPKSIPSHHGLGESRVDLEMMVLNVDDGTEAANMLRGRAGFTTVVVARRGKTPVSGALATCRSFATRSFLVVDSKPRKSK